MPKCRIANGPARLAMLLPMLLLASCAKLDRPLSDPEKAKPDQRLFGAWKYTEVDQEGNRFKDLYLFIGKSDLRDSPPGIMKCIEIYRDDEDNISTDEPSYFFTTSIGNHSYANLLEIKKSANEVAPPRWDKERCKDVLLFQYKVEKNTLVARGIDSEAAEALIRKGQLKGTVREEKGLFNSNEVTLTGAEGLARFLADGGDKTLFPEKPRMVFTRIK